jgi:LPS export ABC transporter protein LptC
MGSYREKIFMSQRSYSSTGLILTTLFSVWLVWHFVIDFKLSGPSNPNYPDSFANNVNVTVMDKKGKPQYKFLSPLIYHYSIDDRTDFATPHVVIYQEGQPPWTANAEHGEAFQGDSKVTLWDDVFFHQPKGAHNSETSIQTALLVLSPETRFATTNKFISAVQPYATVSGIGMDLLSDVHGMYLPQPPKQGEPVYVTSNTARLDKTTDIVTFLGDAKFKQGPNSYAAPKIEYHIKQQMVVSPESSKGRTTIIIQPNSVKKVNKGKESG